MKIKVKLIRNSIKFHKYLGYIGAIALLIFAISGALHPIMSWTGPQAKHFFAPTTSISNAEINAILPILQKNQIKSANLIKIIPSKAGNLLQVTKDNYRYYYDLKNHLEIKNYDQIHAKWLASYYTNLDINKITNISLQTEFDHNYPWVNRLLPVYKVTFAQDDNLTAFIYTELNALANLTNQRKSNFQALFRILHSWSWLDNFEHVRVILMMILLLSLFFMLVTAIGLIFLIKKRKIINKKRKFHRLIAYIIWLPLLAFCVSGTYHLLQYAYGENHHGLKLAHNIDLTKFLNQENTKYNNLQLDPNIKLNNASLIAYNDRLFYRLSIAPKKMGKKITRKQRFSGLKSEKNALYYELYNVNNDRINLTDKDMALYFAQKHFPNLHKQAIKQVKLVTNFGPNYDFRNKRLPVWRIDYDNELGDKLFIDPANGILVDRLVNKARYESYSFSFLHKWNFLTPLIGRKYRDILIVLILALAIIATSLGIFILMKQKRK